MNPRPVNGFLLDDPWTAEDEARWRHKRAAERSATRREVDAELARRERLTELNGLFDRSTLAAWAAADYDAWRREIDARPPDPSASMPLPGSARWYDEIERRRREAEQTSPVLARALKAAYAAIRRRHPDLPEVELVVGADLSGAWGEFRSDRIFVADRRFDHGPEAVLATLLHECAHALAQARGARVRHGGGYHDRRFRALAEELGLRFAHEAPGEHGFAHATLAPGTADAYRDTIAMLGAAIAEQVRADTT